MHINKIRDRLEAIAYSIDEGETSKEDVEDHLESLLEQVRDDE